MNNNNVEYLTSGQFFYFF